MARRKERASRITHKPELIHIRNLLREFNLQAKKGLGQHFLIDRSVLQASLEAAGLVASDIVIEVGPGLGILTEKLAESVKRVIAIELDPRISLALKKRLAWAPNVNILNADVLQSDIASLLGDEPFPVYKVVANLPYYVATAIIRHFLESPIKPLSMVVMVQKEVAENIVALPGKMSILSVSVQIYGKASIVRYVPAESFYPVPKVDSAIVRIDVYDRPIVDVDLDDFFRVVKAGFSAPRKQLRNALAKGLSISLSESAEALDRAGISSQRRAETLSIEEWEGLCRVVSAWN